MRRVTYRDEGFANPLFLGVAASVESERQNVRGEPYP